MLAMLGGGRCVGIKMPRASWPCLVTLALPTGCAYESPSTRTVRTFDQAIAVRSGDQLDKLLQNPIEYGGIAFRDPGCRADFAAPGTIAQNRRGRFLQCLTTLGLHWNPQTVAFDTATFEYHDGFSIEARLTSFERHTRIYWLGYEGRYAEEDSLPTISANALESRRASGSLDAPTDPATVARLAHEPRTSRSTPFSYAIFKICVSETGETKIARRYDASSPIAESVFSELVVSWRFRPVLVDGRPVAACTITRLVTPKDKAPKDLTRLGYRAPAPDGLTMVGSEALVRVSTIDPSKFRLPPEFADDVHSDHTSVRLCIDGSGTVTRADVVETTLITAYDEQILSNVRTWRYQPYVLDGTATPICTTVRIKFVSPQMAESDPPSASGR